MNTVCICGGGALGHVIAGYIASKGIVDVNLLTRSPQKWSRKLTVLLPDGTSITGILNIISNNPEDVVSQADIVIFCLPGYAIPPVLDTIKDHIKPGAFIGCVFSSTGFFDEGRKRLPRDVNLWGFQRVPFIARVEEYGHKAKLLGYKDSHSIAIEGDTDKDKFIQTIEHLFDSPVNLLSCYLEASITNSNPLLHTSRLFILFKDWKPGTYYPNNILFYEEWDDETSELLVDMDHELFELISVLPVRQDFLEPILKHYDSSTPKEMTLKIRSIPSFKGLPSPMIETTQGWMPDFTSRYFIEDFEYGLKYITDLTNNYCIETPNIKKVYNWYNCIKRMAKLVRQTRSAIINYHSLSSINIVNHQLIK